MPLNLKPVALSVLCISVLSSCLTAKKVDKQVAKHYADSQPLQKKKQNDLISITSGLIATNDHISNSVTSTSNMLPLLVYWSWDYKNTCTLNPQIPVNNFTATVLNYGSRRLSSKLNGQRLELVITSIPNQFAINDRAHVIFFGYAVGWDNVSIKAERMEIVVAYKLFKDNAETRSGVISIPNFNDKRNLGMFTSWKKATAEYLDQYDQNITTLSKLVVDRLLTEL